MEFTTNLNLLLLISLHNSKISQTIINKVLIKNHDLSNLVHFIVCMTTPIN